MEVEKNPFKPGDRCYLAWVMGYMAALHDVSKQESEQDEKENRAAGHEGGG